MSASARRYRPETRLVHAGQMRSNFGETSEALYLTQGFVYDSAEQCAARFKGEEPGFLYSRFSNPTVAMFEARMAAFEGAEAARATASGMAAVTTALVAQLKAGDHVVAGPKLPHHGGGDRCHAAGGCARGLGALEGGHAPLEHGDGRIGEARVDEAWLLALEAGRAFLGRFVDEALGQKQRLGSFAELRADLAGVDEASFRTVAACFGRRHCGLLRPMKSPAVGMLPSRAACVPAF